MSGVLTRSKLATLNRQLGQCEDRRTDDPDCYSIVANAGDIPPRVRVSFNKNIECQPMQTSRLPEEVDERDPGHRAHDAVRSHDDEAGMYAMMSAILIVVDVIALLRMFILPMELTWELYPVTLNLYVAYTAIRAALGPAWAMMLLFSPYNRNAIGMTIMPSKARPLPPHPRVNNGVFAVILGTLAVETAAYTLLFFTWASIAFVNVDRVRNVYPINGNLSAHAVPIFAFSFIMTVVTIMYSTIARGSLATVIIFSQRIVYK